MFSESAELYDAIYSSFKNYAAESVTIAKLLREVAPNAHTILDVACGTGEHIKHLRESHGFTADGIDLDPNLLEVARAKVPQAQFTVADMSAFALPERYDVVMCLFSSIGYLKTLDQVSAALRCFRNHLNQGGVVIVEPWFPPGILTDGYTATTRAHVNGTDIERASTTRIDGSLSTLIFDYRIEDAAGVRTMQEVHELGIFSHAEMLAGFEAAQLTTTHDPAGLTNRGLYVGHAA